MVQGNLGVNNEFDLPGRPELSSLSSMSLLVPKIDGSFGREKSLQFFVSLFVKEPKLDKKRMIFRSESLPVGPLDARDLFGDKSANVLR